MPPSKRGVARKEEKGARRTRSGKETPRAHKGFSSIKKGIFIEEGKEEGRKRKEERQ